MNCVGVRIFWQDHESYRRKKKNIPSVHGTPPLSIPLRVRGGIKKVAKTEFDLKISQNILKTKKSVLQCVVRCMLFSCLLCCQVSSHIIL